MKESSMLSQSLMKNKMMNGSIQLFGCILRTIHRMSKEGGILSPNKNVSFVDEATACEMTYVT